MSLMESKVGDELLLVRQPYRHGGEPTEWRAVVTKVARKYLTVECGEKSSYLLEINRETGYEKSDFQPSRVYVSEAAYRANVVRKAAERDIEHRFRHTGRLNWENLSAEELESLGALMGKLTGAAP